MQPDRSTAVHQAYECDGWTVDDAGEIVGKCLEHRQLPKPLTVVEGVDKALADADDEWRRTALRAVERAAATGHEFTTDTLREQPYGVPEPAHANAWGAVMMLCHERGLLERLGDTTSQRPAAQGRKISVWRGRERP